MKLRNLGVSRRSLVIAAAAVATVISLGIGANAALNKISNDARQAVSNIGGADCGQGASRGLPRRAGDRQRPLSGRQCAARPSRSTTPAR